MFHLNFGAYEDLARAVAGRDLMRQALDEPPAAPAVPLVDQLDASAEKWRRKATDRRALTRVRAQAASRSRHSAMYSLPQDVAELRSVTKKRPVGVGPRRAALRAARAAPARDSRSVTVTTASVAARARRSAMFSTDAHSLPPRPPASRRGRRPAGVPRKMDVDDALPPLRSLSPPPTQGDRRSRLVYGGDRATLHGESLVLANLAQAHALQEKLDPRHQLYDWYLEFDMQRDGSSLQTLRRTAQRLADHDVAVLLLIKCTAGDVLGAFLPCGLVGRHETRGFRGGSGSFVFTLRETGTGCSVQAYDAWDEMQVALTADLLVLGAGGGGAAICIDSDLDHGSSHPSATFKNPPLAVADGNGEFEVWQLELWRLGTAFQTELRSMRY